MLATPSSRTHVHATTAAMGAALLSPVTLKCWRGSQCGNAFGSGLTPPEGVHPNHYRVRPCARRWWLRDNRAPTCRQGEQRWALTRKSISRSCLRRSLARSWMRPTYPHCQRSSLRFCMRKLHGNFDARRAQPSYQRHDPLRGLWVIQFDGLKPRPHEI